MAFWSKPKRTKRDPSREQLRNLRHGLVLLPVTVTPRQAGAFPNKVPRQIERIRARRDAENIESTQKDLKRRAAQKDRLDRQAAREKSGSYEGTMALANVLGQRFGRIRRQVRGNGGLTRLS